MKDYIKYDVADVAGVIAEAASQNGLELTDEQIEEIAQAIQMDVMEEMDFETVVRDAAEAYLENNGFYDEDDE